MAEIARNRRFRGQIAAKSGSATQPQRAGARVVIAIDLIDLEKLFYLNGRAARLAAMPDHHASAIGAAKSALPDRHG